MRAGRGRRPCRASWPGARRPARPSETGGLGASGSSRARTVPGSPDRTSPTSDQPSSPPLPPNGQPSLLERPSLPPSSLHTQPPCSVSLGAGSRLPCARLADRPTPAVAASFAVAPPACPSFPPLALDPAAPSALPVVGLTGGIASGKSTVSALLAGTHGLPVVDADLIAREILEPCVPPAGRCRACPAAPSPGLTLASALARSPTASRHPEAAQRTGPSSHTLGGRSSSPTLTRSTGPPSASASSARPPTAQSSTPSRTRPSGARCSARLRATGSPAGTSACATSRCSSRPAWRALSARSSSSTCASGRSGSRRSLARSLASPRCGLGAILFSVG